VLEPDIAQLSFGTTATINTTQDRYLEVQRLLPPYPAAVPGAYNTEIQIFRGFWMVSWFKREFAHEEQRLAAERGIPAEALFDELIKAYSAGIDGPDLATVLVAGRARSWSGGKGGDHWVRGRAHARPYLSAILEGLVYSLRAGREHIERRIKRPIRILRVAGGGSQSDVAMQIAADVFGLTAERSEVYETSRWVRR